MFQPRFLAACLSVLSLAVFAEDWPQWRGPDRDGRVPQGWAVPKQLDESVKAVWKLKVGEGLASPVVAGGRVFLFDGEAGQEILRCLKAEDGSEIWRQPVDAAFKDSQGPVGPRCTPVVDGDRVYVVSCRGELQCRKTSDGSEIWKVNYSKDFGAVFVGEVGNVPGAGRHGNNGSPLVLGSHLYACAGGTNGSGVVCLNKLDGKVVWKNLNDQAAYAPPVLAKLAGKEQLVCFVADGLIGLDPASGKELWRVPIKTAFARHVSTPVWHDDVVVVSSHQVGMIGTRISKDGEGFKAERAWLSKEGAMNFASPVQVGGELYGLGPAKNLICVEITTGKVLWSQDGVVTTSADKAHASFVVMGSAILCLTDGGTAVLFDADRAGYKEHGQAQVCGLNWCNPAYAGGRLYAREGVKGPGQLSCIRLLE